nr:O-antigen ligase family protein [Thalassoroseus pseudoceratinae]
MKLTKVSHSEEKSSRTDLYVLAIACWLLTTATFSLPEREDHLAAGGLDSIGLLKLAIRGFVTMILMWRIKRIVGDSGFSDIRARLLPPILFLVWAVLSVAWSPLRSVSFAQASSLGTLMLVSVLAAHLCQRQGVTEFLLKQLSLILSAVTCLILFCYFLTPSVGSMTREGTGLFHATNTAATASLGLVSLVSIWLIWGFSWTRWLIWMVVPHTMVLVLSANRLCFLVNAITLLTVFYFYGSRLLTSISLATLCILGTSYLLIDPYFSLFESLGSNVVSYASRGQDVSQLSALSGREEMWTAQWKSFLESPVIGHGYFVTSKEGQMYVWYNWANYTAHNLVLQVAVTTGVVGLTLFLLGLVRSYLKATYQLRHKPNYRRLGDFLGLIGMWYLGWSTMNESIMGPVQPESVFFFVMLGIAIGNATSSDRNPVDSKTDLDRLHSPTSRLQRNASNTTVLTA